MCCVASHGRVEFSGEIVFHYVQCESPMTVELMRRTGSMRNHPCDHRCQQSRDCLRAANNVLSNKRFVERDELT